MDKSVPNGNKKNYISKIKKLLQIKKLKINFIGAFIDPDPEDVLIYTAYVQYTPLTGN